MFTLPAIDSQTFTQKAAADFQTLFRFGVINLRPFASSRATALPACTEHVLAQRMRSPLPWRALSRLKQTAFYLGVFSCLRCHLLSENSLSCFGGILSGFLVSPRTYNLPFIPLPPLILVYQLHKSPCQFTFLFISFLTLSSPLFSPFISLISLASLPSQSLPRLRLFILASCSLRPQSFPITPFPPSHTFCLCPV